VASWSSIDYYGRWKALQYYARRFYSPVLVSPHVDDGSVKTYIVSDKTEPIHAQLRVRLMDFDGKVLLEESQAVEVTPLASKMYLDWPLKKLTEAAGGDASRVFVVAELKSGETELSNNLAYLVPVRAIRLKPAQLKVDATGANGSYKIRVTSPVLARSVYVSVGELDAKFSDNYFNLLPGETAVITVTSSASLEALKTQLKVISLMDAFTANEWPATVSAKQ
jgi:beta-mannosidase